MTGEIIYFSELNNKYYIVIFEEQHTHICIILMSDKVHEITW